MHVEHVDNVVRYFVKFTFGYAGTFPNFQLSHQMIPSQSLLASAYVGIIKGDFAEGACFRGCPCIADIAEFRWGVITSSDTVRCREI